MTVDNSIGFDDFARDGQPPAAQGTKALSASVVICSYNRAEELAKTLRSWLSVKQTDPLAELIVVDNNSTDHTAAIVESIRESCPTPLRYVLERESGLSHARNRGVRESGSDLIAFVDDDVLFDENWLEVVIGAFREDASIACVGGNSVPVFEGQRPEWLTDDFLGFYGSTGSGDKDRQMIFPECPFGLNMAFRKPVFSRVGYFDVQLGRKKGALLSNEEWELFYRISQAGLRVQYLAGALLYHRIPRERVSERWLLERYYWQGISEVVCEQSVEPISRLGLLGQGVRAWINLMVPPGRRTPLKLMAHYRDLSFKDKLRRMRKLGKSKQYLRFALRRLSSDGS